MHTSLGVRVLYPMSVIVITLCSAQVAVPRRMPSGTVFCRDVKDLMRHCRPPVLAVPCTKTRPNAKTGYVGSMTSASTPRQTSACG
jgi:hypothetical protein